MRPGNGPARACRASFAGRARGKGTAVAVLLAVAAATASPAGAVAAAPGQCDRVDGVWRSDGYEDRVVHSRRSAAGVPGTCPVLKHLILDVRIDGGGSDALALQVAERLTDAPCLAYTGPQHP